ncbi:uncharacterized protein JCM15063_002487 [Sporobolomyces koalae]|uniref:uncharacterized protein n=1 Tax=Sporobolomyces koalae TaxID=500713 RepID=UPI003170E7FF
MKFSIVATLAFATLFTPPTTLARPSANSIQQLGDAQYIAEDSDAGLEKRADLESRSTRQRPAWLARMTSGSSVYSWSRVVRTRPATTSTTKPTLTTSTPVATPTFIAGSDVRDLALTEHNRFRALHNAPALTWSQPLADAAYKWGSRCVFQHSQGAVGPYGENLAATAGYKTDIVTGACQGWEAEASDYNPSNPNYSHFTQMVWKATTQLGCAQVTCPPGSIFDARYGNSTFYVCEYNPPGNVYPASNFLKNVE